MKRFFYIVVWLVASTVISTGYWQSRQQTVIEASSSFSISWQDLKTDTSIATTVPYGTVNIGAADANRVVAVAIFYRGSFTASVSAVTINGSINASRVTGSASGNASNSFTDIWYASVSSGTTATVTVTYDQNTARSAIEVYRVITSTPTPSSGNGTVNSPTQTTISQSITVPVGGGAIVFVANNGSNGATDVTFTNATADASSLFFNLGSNSIGKTAIVNGTGSVTVGGSVNGSANVMLESLAAWGP